MEFDKPDITPQNKHNVMVAVAQAQEILPSLFDTVVRHLYCSQANRLKAAEGINFDTDNNTFNIADSKLHIAVSAAIVFVFRRRSFAHSCHIDIAVATATATTARRSRRTLTFRRQCTIDVFRS